MALALCCLAALVTAQMARAGKAHEHGVGRLNLVQDGSQWSAELELPLDTVVGFERPPRTPAERQSAQAALKILRDPSGLIRMEAPAPPLTACVPALKELHAPVLEGLAAGSGGHADARILMTIQCPDAARPQRIELPLFTAMPRLKRLEVQAVLPSGQRRLTLTPSRRVIDLRR